MGIFDSVWVKCPKCETENEDKDLYPFKEALKRLYNLDKLYKDMPKLYYNTGEVIEVTKKDILKYINSSRSI